MAIEKGQKDKHTLQKKTTQKTTDRAARTPLKPGVNSGIPKELAIPSPLVTLNFLDLICVYVFSSML